MFADFRLIQTSHIKIIIFHRSEIHKSSRSHGGYNLLESVIGDCLDLPDPFGCNTQFLHQLLCHSGLFRLSFRSSLLPRTNDSTLNHCAMEQTFRAGNLQQCSNLSAASGLTENRHIVRISAKAGNIVLHPSECFHNISHSHIGRISVFLSICRQIQKSQHIQAMIQSHHHDITKAAHVFAVISKMFNTGPRGKSTAMQPHQNRTLPVIVQRLRPDIQILAILILWIENMGNVIVVTGLNRLNFRTYRSINDCFFHTFPGLDRSRHVESFCISILDSSENKCIVHNETAQFPVRSGNHRFIRIAYHLFCQFLDKHTTSHSFLYFLDPISLEKSTCLAGASSSSSLS